MGKMIRDLYDRLTTDELLLLVYHTYPEYKLKSKKSEELLSPQNKSRIAKQLLSKGLITLKKYHEIVGG